MDEAVGVSVALAGVGGAETILLAERRFGLLQKSAHARGTVGPQETYVIDVEQVCASISAPPTRMSWHTPPYDALLPALGV